jgi:hypothetical protein
MKKICIYLHFSLVLVVISGLTAHVSANKTGLNARFMLTLTSFDYVEVNAHFNYFVWTTSKELDVQQMELQASADSNTFVTLQVQPATNTPFSHTYYSSLMDCEQYRFYRLVIVNENGQRDYSKIIHIDNNDGLSKLEISIFPNPVIDLAFNLKVPSTNPLVVKVFTKEGKLLCSTSLQGQSQYRIKLPIAAVANDYLAVQVISNGKTNAFYILNK